MNERLSIGSGMSTGFPGALRPVHAASRRENGLAVDDPAVRSKLATWAVRTTGLKYTGFRALSALSRGEIAGAGKLDRQARRRPRPCKRSPCSPKTYRPRPA